MGVGYVFLSITTPKGNCQPSLFWSPLSRWCFFANPTILGTEIYNNNKACCKGITSWWFQPIWKILYSQNGNLPQIGVNIKKYLKPPPGSKIFTIVKNPPPFPWCFCWPWDPPTQGLGGGQTEGWMSREGGVIRSKVIESMGEISPIYKPFIRIGDS